VIFLGHVINFLSWDVKLLETFLFHHIRIAAQNIKKTAQYYIEAGYSMGEIVYDQNQDVYVAFLEKSSAPPRIELLEPGSNKSPICKTLKKSGVSPYHICYEVKDMAEAIYELKKKKYILLAPPVSAVALGKRNICFLYNKDVGLIELVEIVP
jgi:methylmalonyl-CoA/ethylmalonyl-CoA epimerase